MQRELQGANELALFKHGHLPMIMTLYAIIRCAANHAEGRQLRGFCSHHQLLINTYLIDHDDLVAYLRRTHPTLELLPPSRKRGNDRYLCIVR